jgi:hypothetical protein
MKRGSELRLDFALGIEEFALGRLSLTSEFVIRLFFHTGALGG